MTRQEAIKHLKCSESALYKMFNNGLLVKEGKEITEDSIKKLTGDAKEVFTVQEAAGILGVSNETIIARAKKGELKSFKIGSGKDNSGLRIADIEVEPMVVCKPKATSKVKVKKKPKKVAKQEKKTDKSTKILIKKIQSGESEIYISIKGDQEASDTKLVKDFVRAWIDGSDLEDKLAKLRELL